MPTVLRIEGLRVVGVPERPSAGGRVRGGAKAAAARANGKRGGRPRKVAGG